MEALNETLTQARSSITVQRSQLDARQRENTNLINLNDGLSMRIDKTQSALASTKGEMQALNAQRTAERRE